MLEESFKAIEGVVCRRRLARRAALPDGAVYSACNLAGEPGKAAACEVLYADALVCEDSTRHSRPLCRIPADYEKFFNTVEMAAVDAVEECVGMPDRARAFWA